MTLALTELLWYLCQGTIQMFAALAVDHTLPLNSFIGLGPVATVSMCNPFTFALTTHAGRRATRACVGLHHSHNSSTQHSL